MREGDREYLYECFDKNFPGMKELYQKKFGNAYLVNSPDHNPLMSKFKAFIRENNMLMDNQCFEYMREFPEEKVLKNGIPYQREFEF